MSNASTNEQDNDNQKGLFEDFSFSTVIASGLAAATSFLLSAKIGLAGSIIGVAIGGVASAAASQIYKSLLQASADKLSDLAGGDDEREGQAGAGGAADGVTGGEKGAAAVGSAGAAADLTQVMGGGETSVYPVSVSAAYPVEQVAETGTPIAPTAVRAAAHAKQRRDVRRRATIIAAACAVAAVLIFSLVVTIATKGAGIGGTAEVTSDQPAVSEDEGAQENNAPGHEAPAGRGESDDAEKSDESHVTATTGQDSQGTSDAATQGSTSTDTTSTTTGAGSQGTSSSTGTGSSTGTSSGTGSGSTGSSNTTSGGSSSSSSGSTSGNSSSSSSTSKDTGTTGGGSSSSSSNSGSGSTSSSTGSSSTSSSSTSTTSGTTN